MPAGASAATLAPLAGHAGHAGLTRQVRQFLDQLVSQGRLVRHGQLYAHADPTLRLADYQAIPAPQRQALHLRLGRRLLEESGYPGATPAPAALYAILEQLNSAHDAMPMQAERSQCAQLNLLAARASRLAGGCAAALAYLGAGWRLLGQDCWQRHHALAYALLLEQAACLGPLGRHTEARAAVTELLRRADSEQDRQRAQEALRAVDDGASH
jgi:predicted ATPase